MKRNEREAARARAGERADDGRAGRKFRLSTPLTKAIHGGRSAALAGCPILIWWRFFRHAILGEREREREREEMRRQWCLHHLCTPTDFNLSSSHPFSRGSKTVNNLAKWHNNLGRSVALSGLERGSAKVTATVTKMEGVFVCRSRRPRGNSGQGRSGCPFRTGMRQTSKRTGWELRYAKRRERERDEGDGSSGIKCK